MGVHAEANQAAPLFVEALSSEHDVIQLSLGRIDSSPKSKSWLENALKKNEENGRSFLTVQHVSGLGLVALAAASLIEKLGRPPSELEIGSRWVALRPSNDAAQGLSAIAVLSTVLAGAGVAFATVACGARGSRFFVRQRDLRAAGAALARAGHAITPAALICALPFPSLQRGSEAPPSDGAGIWSLVLREQQLGIADKWESEPLRLQSRSGVYVDIMLPHEQGDIMLHASCGGHHSVLLDAGRRVSIRHREVDFQPPTAESWRELVRLDSGMMDVVALPPHQYREVWRRVGSADEVVVLELAGDAKDRVGFWVFYGSRFARVLGPAPGEGLIAGTCCSSLQQLSNLKGSKPVQDELHEDYEAMDGEVECPGKLRTCRDAWNSKLAGQMYFDATDSNIGGVINIMRGEGLLVHTLPCEGGEQTWRIREWTFDPFSSRDVQTAQLKAAAPASSAKQSARSPSSSSSKSSADVKKKSKRQLQSRDASRSRSPANKQAGDKQLEGEKKKVAFGFARKMHEHPNAGAVVMAAHEIMKRASEKKSSKEHEVGANTLNWPQVGFSNTQIPYAGTVPSTQFGMQPVRLNVPPPPPPPPPVYPAGYPLPPPPPRPPLAYDPFAAQMSAHPAVGKAPMQAAHGVYEQFAAQGR